MNRTIRITDLEGVIQYQRTTADNLDSAIATFKALYDWSKPASEGVSAVATELDDAGVPFLAARFSFTPCHASKAAKTEESTVVPVRQSCAYNPAPRPR